MGCVPVVRTVRPDCRHMLVSNGFLVVLMSVIMVATALVSHLFPFRTEKLSPTAPMVLRKRESRSPPPFFKSSCNPFSGSVPGEGFAFSRDSLPPCCFLHPPCCFPHPACCFPLPPCCFPHPAASLLRLFTFYKHLPWLCTVSFSVSFCSCLVCRLLRRWQTVRT